MGINPLVQPIGFQEPEEVQHECFLRVSTLVNIIFFSNETLRRINKLTLKIIFLPRPPPPDMIAQASPSFTVQPKSRSNGELV